MTKQDQQLIELRKYIIGNEHLPYDQKITMLFNIMEMYPNVNDLENNIRGICAEFAVHYTLDMYRTIRNQQFTIHNDVIFKKSTGYSNEIDTIVVNDKYILCIETKSYRGNLLIDNSNIIQRSSGTMNPFEQNAKHVNTLYKAVKDLLPNGDERYLFNMVVIVGKCNITDVRSTELRNKYLLCNLQDVINCLDYINYMYNSIAPISITDVARRIEQLDNGKTLQNRNEHIKKVSSLNFK